MPGADRAARRGCAGAGGGQGRAAARSRQAHACWGGWDTAPAHLSSLSLAPPPPLLLLLQPVPAGSILLVTTQLESIDRRKVWMSATVTDGSSDKPYAHGRALFVAPTITRQLQRLMGMEGGGGKRAAPPAAPGQ